MTLGLSGATVGLSSFFGERRAHLRTPILIFKHLKLFLVLSVGCFRPCCPSWTGAGAHPVLRRGTHHSAPYQVLGLGAEAFTGIWGMSLGVGPVGTVGLGETTDLVGSLCHAGNSELPIVFLDNSEFPSPTATVSTHSLFDF